MTTSHHQNPCKEQDLSPLLFGRDLARPSPLDDKTNLPSVMQSHSQSNRKAAPRRMARRYPKRRQGSKPELESSKSLPHQPNMRSRQTEINLNKPI